MAVPGEKATFVGGEDRPDVTSMPRVVMGGSGATEPGDDRVKRFLGELRGLDVRQLREPGSDKDPDKDDRDGPQKASPDLAKYQSDQYKNIIDTILYGGEQLDVAEMSELLNGFSLSDQQAHEAIEALWGESASPKK